MFIFNRSWYGRLLYFLRISAREKVRTLMGRLGDENAPLELKSKPQGSDKDAAADS